jgi:hypothetical protein
MLMPVGFSTAQNTVCPARISIIDDSDVSSNDLDQRTHT